MGKGNNKYLTSIFNILYYIFIKEPVTKYKIAKIFVRSIRWSPPELYH